MSWLGDMLSNKLSISATGSTGDSGGVYRIVGPTPTTVPNGGYAPGVSTTTYPYITTGTGGLQNSYSNVHISGIHPRITTDKSIIDLDELSEFIKVMKERLLIITPDFEKHEKYAALKKAYDNYKLIESMLSGDNNDNK